MREVTEASALHGTLRLMEQWRFSARVVSGSGRGKTLGVPTLNMDLRDVPADLLGGVFAAWVTSDGKRSPSALYHGPRPTFGDTRSCEAHLIDTVIPSPPEIVDVEIVEFLRGVSTYPSAEALSKQMMDDIQKARDILGT